MMVLTIVTGGDRRDVVLRLRPRPPALLEPYDLERQFDILRALEATPVRAPRALWLEETGDVLGRPFFVMERVPGDVYEMQAPDGPDATPRTHPTMCLSMAEQLAADSSGRPRMRRAWLRSTTGHPSRPRVGATGQTKCTASSADRCPRSSGFSEALKDTKPEPYPAIALVHGDAKPGNFAFVGDDVSAVFDWEMTTVGDPLTDIGWMELLWMQPVGITSHPAAPSIEEFLSHYESVSGIRTQNRSWYRALNAYKMAVICLIGSMLFESGGFRRSAIRSECHGISPLTQLGLAELAVDEKLERPVSTTVLSSPR